MTIRELPNAPILYDDSTNQITGLKHPSGVEMPLGTGAIMNQAYASSLTLDLSQKPIVAIAALTGAITIANPSRLPAVGQEVQFHFTQDGTGGRAVSWGSNFVFPTAWSNSGNTANTGSSITFVSNGTKLHAKGGNAWA
jgi:hypothetical protein